ncbi:hypothetical protein [Maridesulfovibrio zosterae]|uniref:hypothetical protein n=1 Tax=Maridesulfovibrio zosterae TaxID=82171 RepID=UPI00041B3B1A|nr:hypothetical protein [Maridesulfovibrio zosterae]
MADGKKLTDRFLVALFKRGKTEYIPISYLKFEGDKVLAKGETDRLPSLLAEMVGKGILEEKISEYRLLSDPFA